jgi:hypothetical protein
MDELTQGRLLAEYQANVDLWQHDDQLRQQRSGNIMTINTGLLAVLGTLATLDPAAPYFGFPFIMLLFGILGSVVALNWYFISARNAEYVRFRRIQLRSIEAQLPWLTTFLNTYTAFYRKQRVTFPRISFEISKQGRLSSTRAENLLPVFMGLLWTGCIAVGLFLLFSTSPQKP